MLISEIDGLFERLKRLSGRLEKKEGDGYQWRYTFPDGVEATYILKNIRNLEEIEDDISNLFIWAWNLKDYLKELAITMGRNPQVIEGIVNSNINLQICADIANGLKHGRLNTSRSNLFPKLSRLRFEFSHEALSSITYRGQEIEIDISKPEDVVLSISILDRDGREVDDGFKILSDAVTAWEHWYTAL